MKLRALLHWLTVLILTLTFSTCLRAQPSQTITFRLSESNTLRLTSYTPKLRQGEKLIVEITNVTTQKPSWIFTFDSIPMMQNPPSGANPLRFVSDPVPPTRLGDMDLVFRDSEDVVAYDAANSSIAIPVGAGEATHDRSRPTAPGTTITLKKLYDRSKNEVNLYFGENGLLYRGSIPRDLDDNDIINIYLVAPRKIVQTLSVEVKGAFAAEDINIIGAGGVGELASALGALQGTETEPPEEQLVVTPMGSYGPYAAPSITIAINSVERGVATPLRSHTARIIPNYTAGLRFGVGWSHVRFNEFKVLRSADSDTSYIRNVSDKDGDPHFYVAVVFYDWQFWKGGSWKGRDLTERSTLLDMFSPYVGLGLKNIGEEFLFGISLEPIRGLDFTWGAHAAKTEELTGGFVEGDPFKGETREVPLKEEWRIESGFVGVSVDLRIAAQVLSAVLRGGP